MIREPCEEILEHYLGESTLECDDITMIDIIFRKYPNLKRKYINELETKNVKLSPKKMRRYYAWGTKYWRRRL